MEKKIKTNNMDNPKNAGMQKLTNNIMRGLSKKFDI